VGSSHFISAACIHQHGSMAFSNLMVARLPSPVFRLLLAHKVPAVDAMPPAQLELGLAFRAARVGLVLTAVRAKVDRTAGR